MWKKYVRRNSVKKIIIIPAYNEEENIERTVNAIQKSAQGFDYVIINDCSTDNTRKICEEKEFNIVNLPINLGIGGAVQTGYKYAYENGYDVAVQVDGDGQHDPEFLNTMADYLIEHQVDMVIGSRFIEKKGFQSSITRRMGIQFFSKLIKVLTGKKITDPTSGLRMIGRNVMEIFSEDYPRDYPEPESIVAVLRKNMKIEEIPVVMLERQGGVSSISPKKSIYYMIKVTLAILIERIRN
jgi:glycosyltransferase involved in cell wall biosynthesis|nr:glycosyltransferase family 2 protein [Dorea formicigenerans]